MTNRLTLVLTLVVLLVAVPAIAASPPTNHLETFANNATLGNTANLANTLVNPNFAAGTAIEINVANTAKTTLLNNFMSAGIAYSPHDVNVPNNWKLAGIEPSVNMTTNANDQLIAANNFPGAYNTNQRNLTAAERDRAAHATFIVQNSDNNITTNNQHTHPLRC